MKVSSFFGILLATLPALAVPFHDTSSLYDNVKVLRIPTGNVTERLDALVSKYDLTLWTLHPLPNSHLDVEVPQDKYSQFIGDVNAVLNAGGIQHSIVTMHEDLGDSIRKESENMVSAQDLKLEAGALAGPEWFNAYHPYADHLTFLDDLVTTFPNNAKIVSSGTSIGGRDIKGINIFGSSGSGTKPAVIWHGTVHAREWIGTMVVEYLAYNLLYNYANTTDIKSYVDKYDFYIFPIVNPDGFVYTQTNDRMWRKNRQTPPSGSTCYGRDINRNWNVQWSTSGGASTSPCAEDYKGLAAQDAQETKNLAAFLDTRAKSAAGAKFFADWHSYSQLFMTPYGYSCSKAAPDATELNKLAAGFSTALKASHGTSFTSGPICTTIYPVTGSSTDYSYDVSKIKYSFAAELRDTGNSGFVLPANQIRPSGEEVFAGVKYLLANIK
ncbi:putative carboxypeptidase [Crepidotus variabilis]|uniref:Carboxypeptidase n=1 Tax=Crepidotus variabilis TaxID=179855 RepID=A0A9P6E8A9_9AGAR|nr:putative carboxypeptidase [Crepidotus variabilis]